MQLFKSGSIDDLNTHIPDENYLLVLKGQIVDSNCLEDQFDFWTLLGYAFMNGAIKPEARSRRHR